MINGGGGFLHGVIAWVLSASILSCCLCCQHGRLPSLHPFLRVCVCVCVCVPPARTCTVCDSSSIITSGCKIALWGNQYVWIWFQLHIHTHTHTTRSRSVSLFVTPPSFLSYKTPAFGAAARGLLTFTRGDVTVSPGPDRPAGTIIRTASVTTGLRKPPNATDKQTWLLLRNPWNWCLSSRENVSVSHVFSSIL